MKEFRCPECGAEIHPNSRSCGACGAYREEGSSWNNGWRKPEAYDGIDLPDDEELDQIGEEPNRKAMKIFWWVVALLTLIAFTRLVIPIGCALQR